MSIYYVQHPGENTGRGYALCTYLGVTAKGGPLVKDADAERR